MPVPRTAITAAAAMGSSFGQLFRITTLGESHGGGVGVVIDGCPPRIALSEDDIQRELDRRRPGQSAIVTPREEADRCRDSFRRLRGPHPRHADRDSGHEQGRAARRPIAEMKTTYRPSHADFTYEAKYGIRNWQGGGRASARETIGRVAAGAVARKVLDAVLSRTARSWPTSRTIHEIAARRSIPAP